MSALTVPTSTDPAGNEAAPSQPAGWLQTALVGLGDWALFSCRAIFGIFDRNLRFRTVVPVFYNIGVNSVGVMVVTGLFLGLVLAEEAYAQFHPYGLDTALGSISNAAILSELGPVLAGIMLGGRVGSAMAAELGTMRVTDQIDALSCLGVNPIHHLVTPRFLACLLMIPLLTVVADSAGIVGSTLICVYAYGIDSHHYWEHTLRFVGSWEVLTGLLKSIVFGGVLALISCHRGFNSKGGAQGVGRAATQAFVFSFLAILILDFFLVFSLHALRPLIMPVIPRAGFQS
jgi:phospholipid/cholesterol/gamma-HCH transport system permease protein